MTAHVFNRGARFGRLDDALTTARKALDRAYAQAGSDLLSAADRKLLQKTIDTTAGLQQRLEVTMQRESIGKPATRVRFGVRVSR